MLNSWAGTTSDAGLGPFWVLRGTVTGDIDPRTGYLCDVKAIDAVLRRMAAGPLRAAAADHSTNVVALARALRAATMAADDALPARLAELELDVSPYTRLSVRKEKPDMVFLTQSFEFAAAHRLFSPELSDAENARLFGKCSNPHGHGHNYLLEITVGGSVDQRTGAVLDLALLDRTVRTSVIEPFDHKNLNVQCEEFARLNPTVENIARVIFKRLEGAVRPAVLARVRLWETPKTCAECTSSDE